MCDILVGARGWDHPSWLGEFYPEDLPEDWRLAYYANAFRSVLVPAQVLVRVHESAFAGWVEDVPAGFRFYLEVSTELVAAYAGESAPFVERIGPLAALVGGVVLRPSDGRDDAGGLRAWATALAGGFPVSLWPQAGIAASFPGVGRSWEPGQSPDFGGDRGCFGVVHSATPDPRELRAQVEAFMAWAGDCVQAMLCFRDAPHVPEQMTRARVIAELLGG